MPFLGRCPFCRKRIRFPDSAMGASITCPACSNAFTAAPSDDDGPDVPNPSSPVIALAPVASSAPLSPTVGLARPKTMPPIAQPAPPSRATVESESATNWRMPLGVASLICAGVGLLGAAIHGRNWLLPTMIGLSFVFGSCGTYLAVRTKDLYLPALSGIVALSALIIGLFSSSLPPRPG